MRFSSAALRASVSVFLALVTSPLVAQPIQTIVGPGSNDGRLATTVRIFSPRGLAADASGNLLVAEDDANRVTRIEAATKLLRHVAGNGGAGLGADGGPAATATLPGPPRQASPGF